MGLKKLKIKIIKRRKEQNGRIKKKGKKTTPQNCKSPTRRQKFITTIKSVTEYAYIDIYP